MTSGYTVTGSNLGDYLYGTAFDDTLNGGGGDDQLFSTTFHNGGVDTLKGGAGNDTLEIYDSAGTFDGGIGNDTFKISYSTGTVDGGAGTDTVISDGLGAVSYSNVEILDATSGYIFATIAQLSSFTTVINSAQPDSRIAFHLGGTGGVIDFSTLLTSAYSGYVSGQDLTSGVTVTGTTNNDTLEGSEFNDTINGGAGADGIHASPYDCWA